MLGISIAVVSIQVTIPLHRLETEAQRGQCSPGNPDICSMARVGFEPGSAWVHLQRSSPSSTLSPLEEKGKAGGYSGSSRPLTISLWDILETATKLHFYLVYINSNTCNLSLHPCVSLAGDVPMSREPPGTSITQINFFPQFLLIPEATKPARQYFCNFLNPTEES